MFVSTALQVDTAYLSTVDLQPETGSANKIADKTVFKAFWQVIFYPANFLLFGTVFLIVLLEKDRLSQLLLQKVFSSGKHIQELFKPLL